MPVGKVGLLRQELLGPAPFLPKLTETLGKSDPDIAWHDGILGTHDLLNHDSKGV